MTLTSAAGSVLRRYVAAPLYHTAREQVAMARYGRHSESPSLPIGRRLWLWRRGFLPQAETLYDFETHSPATYLSTRQHYRTGSINGHWRHLVENKLAAHWLLSPFEAERQQVAGVVTDGRALSADRQVIASATATDAHDALRVPSGDTVPAATFVRERLDDGGQVVLKPVFGGRGEGIVFAARDEQGVSLNGESVSEHVFEERMADLDGYLVADFVEQADYADALYPDATNTIRILTALDPDTREAFVAAAIHRIGTADSAPADNCSQGGLTAEIDRETGRLGDATTIDPSQRVRYDTHPESGAPLAGATVPGWDRLRTRMTAIATELPYLPYLGWDLVVTGEDSFRVLELNNLVGVESLQVHRPLLADDRLRAFYERHGVC